jgi:hypothetical protein
VKTPTFVYFETNPFAPLEATNSFWALSITASHLHKSIFLKELSFATKMIVDRKTKKNIFLTKLHIKHTSMINNNNCHDFFKSQLRKYLNITQCLHETTPTP